MPFYKVLFPFSKSPATVCLISSISNKFLITKNATKPTQKIMSVGMLYIYRSTLLANFRSKSMKRLRKTKLTAINTAQKKKNWLSKKASIKCPDKKSLTKCVPPQLMHFPPNSVIKQVLSVSSIAPLSSLQKISNGTRMTSQEMIIIFL